MFRSFFAAAAKSPARQIAFRGQVVVHLVLMTICFLITQTGPAGGVAPLGLCLLVAGIVEGALLVGWRLTQLPKSRALELLLASPLRPHLIFLAEATVGLTRLALVTLAGLPLLLLLAQNGFLDYRDLVPLLLMPLTWGGIAGLSLTAWAYEPLRLRRWGQRLMLLLILFYLVIGILAGEHLALWLKWLPSDFGVWFLAGFHGFHQYNPFAVMQYALTEIPELSKDRLWLLETPALVLVVLLLARAALRFQGHFQERHYSPIPPGKKEKRENGLVLPYSFFSYFLFPFSLADRPLSWWAVKRVSEYAGKVNLWLAGGFGVLYAVHTVAGPNWPVWMGRQAFVIFDNLIGVGGVAVALMVLAAVPAAFQYGLWDSNTQDRCRRLELLLLTKLDAGDFWRAAMAAAWRRGGGYAAVAVLLWLAAAGGGRISPGQLLLALNAAALLWLMYFALGFRAFASGMQAGNLGLLLTTALPLSTIALFRAGLPGLAALTPPGCVFLAGTSADPLDCLPGILLMALITLAVQRRAVANCLADLRRWYERFHGQKILN